MEVTKENSDAVQGASAKEKGDKMDVDGEDSDEEGDEEPVYEIEKIIDAKMGYYRKGHCAYYVSWVGYDETENSWVDENDANADELITAYWESMPRERIPKEVRKKRKSLAGPKSPVKARKPRSKAISVDSDAPSVTKRGRQSKANEPEASDADTAGPNRKKAKTNGKQATKKAADGKSKQRDESEFDDGAHNPELMLKYMDQPSWEDIIEVISTVEATSDDKLLVYFDTKKGERGVTEAKVLRRRAPDMLFDFYESNLRWRPKGGEDAANSGDDAPAEAASVTEV
ncbi:hypothetical protein BOTBODRAFT_112034 [Botryobasidium botryosum FD-172 SS1]|uniref:Chromo domain-containing protein n=1 Tax=Botryobasidium botryosum (strain FD-172 SS1) TaxID=930990 RepID=A0A067MN41_BOTB1|nr:hypothetical protein BOTBODRAFT_112034 [Botryobasidium botryosum FD-172 SS1]